METCSSQPQQVDDWVSAGENIMKTLSKNRTNVDFSKHELIVTNQDGLLVHHLKHPEYSQMYSVKFINTNGIMAVTGDYGNWIFCREFHPSDDGYVSDYYWIEKLTIASSQSGLDFDNEKTKKSIEEGINGGLEEYGYNGDELDLMIEYYNELLDYVDLSRFEYTSFAYNNYPGFTDSECVPFIESPKIWLKIIFDAFEEICDRIKIK